MSDAVDIDGPALLADLEALNSFGAGRGESVNRVAFSAADLAGRDYIDGRLRELGLVVRRDALLSTIGRLPGADTGLAPLAVGSHTDTVPDGGRYDGALGVVAAIACARALVSGGAPLRHPLEVINFVSEEATMGAGTLGSRAMVGEIEDAALDAPAWDGRAVREHLRAAGVDESRIGEARRAPGEVAAYLELHIEQGGTLWRSGRRLAVVEGIVGIRRYQLEFAGEPNHAGTTAMEDRRDALVMAAPLVGAVREIALACGIVGTVGMLRVEPGASNVIPGRVAMECELRSLEEARMDRAESLLGERTRARGGSVRRLAAKEPVRCDPGLLAVLDEVASGFDAGVRRMPSGAGHDAMSLATICPVAMLFVPSERGVSHAPGERTSPEDCVLGARALLAAVREVDRRLD